MHNSSHSTRLLRVSGGLDWRWGHESHRLRQGAESCARRCTERDKLHKTPSTIAAIVRGVCQPVWSRNRGRELGLVLPEFRSVVPALDRAHVPDSFWLGVYVASRRLFTILSAHNTLPDPLEDVLNVLITIGSPALSAYSLEITHLNTHWLGTAFLDLKYPNSQAISTVISSLQHVPIRISLHPNLLPSLIVLPQNDGYWELLLKGVEKTRRWSIPLVMNFVWVVFAILLTVIDSFHLPPEGDVGYAIVATWTYLLPLIMGWLYVGSQPEPNHLRDCLEAADQIAWVATEQRDRPVRARDIAGRWTQAIEFMRWDDGVDTPRKDELRSVPVFNYTRTFTWSLSAQHVLLLVKNAAAKAELRIPVDNYRDGQGAAWVAGEQGGGVASENRLGTDEQVIRYCTEGARDGPSRWARGVWGRVVLAALFALGLQWGTVGAAVVIHYWKAPVGLGCRALSFFMYGVAGTLVLFLCLASSVLAHVSRPQNGPVYRRPWSQMCLNGGAVFCGYLGKSLAIASGLGILVVCFFQSAGTFNNCYCSSMTFGKGFGDVVFLSINYVIAPSLVHVWIGGLIMAFSTAVLFGFSIYLGTPPRR